MTTPSRPRQRSISTRIESEQSHKKTGLSFCFSIKQKLSPFGYVGLLILGFKVEHIDSFYVV